jgi:Flp pilus assembly CpaF family ATPase
VREVTFKEYLKTILDQKQTEDLLAAAEEGKTIIIKGKQGQTGKSTLKSILNKKGIKAIEEYETFEISLDKNLETPIANFETTVLF